MKTNRKFYKLPYLIVFFLVFLFSCSKDDNGSDYTYYESKDLLISYTSSQLKGLVDFASLTIPDLAGIKPLIKSDIDIYKVVYKTTIKDKQTEASGVMCVPKDPGSYPVLSFQNGTNTLYSNAPTEIATGLTYQLVELIASMGYIVVIADYPGFGESTEVVHPYLVKEPTVTSLVDYFSALKEIPGEELPGITLNNDFYLIGYSQGGWATLALHKSLELDYGNDFNLRGTVCGAGPYDIGLLLGQMTSKATYPVPAYLAYIVNAYTSYSQFTNPVTDIFNPPYASKVSTLFNGNLSIDQVSSQLTTSIPGLITPDFLSGYLTAAKYSTVRDALTRNSISAWKTNVPLLLVHGGSDTQVNPISTENMYAAMIQAGTSTLICKKIIVPGADHGDGLIPSMLEGIFFLNGIKGTM